MQNFLVLLFVFLAIPSARAQWRESVSADNQSKTASSFGGWYNPYYGLPKDKATVVLPPAVLRWEAKETIGHSEGQIRHVQDLILAHFKNGNRIVSSYHAMTTLTLRVKEVSELTEYDFRQADENLVNNMTSENHPYGIVLIKVGDEQKLKDYSYFYFNGFNY